MAKGRTPGFSSGFNRKKDQREEQPPPPGLAVRQAAAAALADIAGQGRTLDERLAADEAAGRLAAFDARDRALLRSIVITALRRLGTIRAILGALMEKPLPRKAQSLDWVLVAGAAQILFMDVPDRAAVDLAVHTARRDSATNPFGGLVNAVLRNVSRQREELLAGADDLADLPQWLATRWRKTWGEDTARQIAGILRQEPTLDLTVRADADGWAQRLGGVVLPTGSVRLETHSPVTELEGYGSGDWWVQDAAAALPARLLKVSGGERVADLCAAPGGKTAQLAAAGASVVALDRSAERMKRLHGNLERLGLTAEMQVGDVLAFDAEPFDAILLDAPCTATGTIRRHPDVAWTKRHGDIAKLAGLQTKMIDRALGLLKPGGRLVYCTCSLEPEEGEAQIASLLRRNPDIERIPVAPEEVGGLESVIDPQGDVRTLPCYLPNGNPRLAGMDGFFMSRLRRVR